MFKFFFIASVNPILYVGARQVFIDSKYDTWNMYSDALGRALTPKTSPKKQFSISCNRRTCLWYSGNID
ncbi:MAG: DegT/DnrJ/EryC1/StrS family aminotransferase [Flavobacteriales bacterium AspAUS03]